ncbi:MAG: class I SAM-dependent methyltransferase [Candidatus Thorarchaeota archaeon]
MYEEWLKFIGELPRPSLDIGSGGSSGRTVSLDPYPRGPVDVRAVGERIPFLSCTFKSVVLESVMKHVVSPIEVLVECNRVTVPRGLLFISSPVNSIDHHRHSFTSEQLVDTIRDAGYEILRRKGLGVSQVRLDRYLSRLIPNNYLRITIPIRFCKVLFVAAKKELEC